MMNIIVAISCDLICLECACGITKKYEITESVKNTDNY